MSTRREPQETQKSALEIAGARVRQRALKGTEASTVGFVLVGYIGAFAFVGYWLDTHFKTSWIVAVGVLLGAVIGFREMFRMAQKLGRESIVADDENARQKMAQSAMPESDFKVATNAIATPSTPDEEIEVVERKRIFQVPAPPVASFDKSKPVPNEARNPISHDELLEELLDDESDQESDKLTDEEKQK